MKMVKPNSNSYQFIGYVLSRTEKPLTPREIAERLPKIGYRHRKIRKHPFDKTIHSMLNIYGNLFRRVQFSRPALNGPAVYTLRRTAW